MNRKKMRFNRLFSLAVLCLFMLSACAPKVSSAPEENDTPKESSTSKENSTTEENGLPKENSTPETVYDVTKVIEVYDFGSLDSAEMDIYTPDGVIKSYIVPGYSDSSIDLFSGEIPSGKGCTVEERTISEEDWNSIVDSINDNQFMDLPEELPEVEADDGAYHYITVETTNGIHTSGGYCAGNGTGEEHQRFYGVKSILMDKIKR